MTAFTSPCGRFVVIRKRGRWQLWRAKEVGAMPCGLAVTKKRGKRPLGTYDTMTEAIETSRSLN